MNEPVRNVISDGAVTRHTPVRNDQDGTVLEMHKY